MPTQSQQQLELHFRKPRARVDRTRADDRFHGLAVRSHTEVGEILGISRQRVAYIEAQAMRKLTTLFSNCPMSTAIDRNQCSIQGPCGHQVLLDDAFIRRDHYQCPFCAAQWHYIQAPPEVLSTGFVMPGLRRLVITRV